MITNSSELILLINIVLSLVYGWKHWPLLKYFSWLLFFSLIVQIVAKMMWLQKMNNLPLLHFYTLVEFVLISLFYHQIFKQNLIWSKNIRWFIASVLALILANSIFFQPITVFNANTKTLTQVIYIAYAVGFYLNATHHQAESYHNVLKTVNSAILLYYTGSLFIFMFSNVLLGLEQSHNLFWVANAVLYLIFQLLVFTAIWKFRQTKSTYS